MNRIPTAITIAPVTRRPIARAKKAIAPPVIKLPVPLKSLAPFCLRPWER